MRQTQQSEQRRSQNVRMMQKYSAREKRAMCEQAPGPEWHGATWSWGSDSQPTAREPLPVKLGPETVCAGAASPSRPPPPLRRRRNDEVLRLTLRLDFLLDCVMVALLFYHQAAQRPIADPPRTNLSVTGIKCGELTLAFCLNNN